MRLTLWRLDDDPGLVRSLPVLSMRRLCAEVQLILRHLLCLCEFNHSEFHGHSNLRDRGERHELPLLYLSERKRIHLHVVMS